MSVCLCAADAQSPRETPVWAEAAAVLSIPALPHPSSSARDLGPAGSCVSVLVAADGMDVG